MGQLEHARGSKAPCCCLAHLCCSQHWEGVMRRCLTTPPCLARQMAGICPCIPIKHESTTQGTRLCTLRSCWQPYRNVTAAAAARCSWPPHASSTDNLPFQESWLASYSCVLVQISWAAACQQAQPRLGLQPHLHDRLHHPDGLLPLRGHHAAAPRLGRLPADQSAQLPGLPLVQPHRGVPSCPELLCLPATMSCPMLLEAVYAFPWSMARAMVQPHQDGPSCPDSF